MPFESRVVDFGEGAVADHLGPVFPLDPKVRAGKLAECGFVRQPPLGAPCPTRGTEGIG